MVKGIYLSKGIAFFIKETDTFGHIVLWTIYTSHIEHLTPQNTTYRNGLVQLTRVGHSNRLYNNMAKGIRLLDKKVFFFIRDQNQWHISVCILMPSFSSDCFWLDIWRSLWHRIMPNIPLVVAKSFCSYYVVFTKGWLIQWPLYM